MIRQGLTKGPYKTFPSDVDRFSNQIEIIAPARGDGPNRKAWTEYKVKYRNPVVRPPTIEANRRSALKALEKERRLSMFDSLFRPKEEAYYPLPDAPGGGGGGGGGGDGGGGGGDGGGGAPQPGDTEMGNIYVEPEIAQASPTPSGATIDMSPMYEYMRDVKRWTTAYVEKFFKKASEAQISQIQSIRGELEGATRPLQESVLGLRADVGVLGQRMGAEMGAVHSRLDGIPTETRETLVIQDSATAETLLGIQQRLDGYMEIAEHLMKNQEAINAAAQARTGGPSRAQFEDFVRLYNANTRGLEDTVKRLMIENASFRNEMAINLRGQNEYNHQVSQILGAIEGRETNLLEWRQSMELVLRNQENQIVESRTQTRNLLQEIANYLIENRAINEARAIGDTERLRQITMGTSRMGMVLFREIQGIQQQVEGTRSPKQEQVFLTQGPASPTVPAAPIIVAERALVRRAEVVANGALVVRPKTPSPPRASTVNEGSSTGTARPAGNVEASRPPAAVAGKRRVAQRKKPAKTIAEKSTGTAQPGVRRSPRLAKRNLAKK